jgi:hypothetical protein
MIPRLALRRLAHARLADSRALYLAGRYDAALYLCGYAVELALKARICRTLRWQGYPESRTEFANYGSFRIHDLQVLLELSGRKEQIKSSTRRLGRKSENGTRGADTGRSERPPPIRRGC